MLLLPSLVFFHVRISEISVVCVCQALCMSSLYLACGIDDFFSVPNGLNLYSIQMNTLEFCFFFSSSCALISRLICFMWTYVCAISLSLSLSLLLCVLKYAESILLPCFKICAHTTNISNDCAWVSRRTACLSLKIKIHIFFYSWIYEIIQLNLILLTGKNEYIFESHFKLKHTWMIERLRWGKRS